MIKESPPVDGVAAVLLPGEPEAVTRSQRERDGTQLPAEVWSEIVDLAEELGVALEPE